MVIDKIQSIVKEKGPAVIVLRGFETNKMPKSTKYFSFNIDFYDTVQMDALKKQVVEEVIINRTFSDNYKWMTIEEYQLFKEQLAINKMPILVLENNLYSKQFPYLNSLSNIESIYYNLYYQEDNELDIEQQNILKNVSFFYGRIDFSKSSGLYYVTYPELDMELEVYDLYEKQPIPVDFKVNTSLEAYQRVELSEDEIPFLDMETNILEAVNQTTFVLILSGSPESLPNCYLERLNILSSQTSVHFIFETHSLQRQIIENKDEYLKILKKIYHYDSFRDILFYKNIENHSKDTINISQAQIIDDIVKQSENAMNGESFRDIYITASTGAGKSVMFQIPALYLAQKYKSNKPLTLVISPLIGLMNDQVASMRRKGINSCATINGNTPPYEKETILERIQDEEIDILYLSPETLQARSDIKMLIGNRSIGVVIIDEAHIVTTWGKSFRADYWYLGIYLSKLRKQYKFPIVTFTATAIYGGTEDMYLDTRNSLNMISPISFFGKVRRDDLLMVVKNSKKELESEGRDYRKTKDSLALKHLKRAYKSGEKSLIYFPTIKLLLNFYSFILQNEPLIAKETGKYYGTLQKEEKDEVLAEYKNSELQFVLATKAFGMGIDISDITNVYHYAPTGNVVDYIQEIGRAARDKTKVKYGFGIIDFLPKDLNEVKQLHGMSAIKKTQILEVMQKILSVYKEKGNNRNLIISPEDFKYIFAQKKKDEDSLDNKVKTVLLMIEKDFSSPNKLGYSPFVARPRSLFGNDLIFVTNELELTFINSRLGKYFKKLYYLKSQTYSGIYQVNLSGIWEKYYKKMSFPSFKYALFNVEERQKLTHNNIFKKLVYTSGVEVSLSNNTSVKNVISQYKTVLNSFEQFVNEQRISDKQFTISDLGTHFMKGLKISDKFESRAFAQTIINSAFEFGKIKNLKFIEERKNSSEDNQRYVLYRDGEIFSKFIMESILSALNPNDNFVKEENNITSFNFRSQGNEMDSKIAALGIGEARKILSYSVIGGNNPQIYLRMNSVYPLEKSIKQATFYKNSVLEDVQIKHVHSVEMLKFLFMKEQPERSNKEKIVNYSMWFWDNIENYFMGILPNEVSDAVSRDL